MCIRDSLERPRSKSLQTVASVCSACCTFVGAEGLLTSASSVGARCDSKHFFTAVGRLPWAGPCSGCPSLRPCLCQNGPARASAQR
eukprot:11494498-Alexandrium_andersonii.AAC.1